MTQLSHKSNQAVLSGPLDLVNLPSGLEEILPWASFDSKQAAPDGNMETAFHK